MTTQTQKTTTWAVAEPAQGLTPDMSLAELRQVRNHWTTEAQTLGYFDQLLEIARELGRPAHTRVHGVWRVWSFAAPIPVTPLTLIYWPKDGRLIKAGGYDSQIGKDTSIREKIEMVFAVLGPQGWTLDQGLDRFGVPSCICNGLRVCHYAKSSHPTGAEPATIIPGQWLTAALAFASEAQERTRQAALKAQEQERQALLAELLVGMEI